MELPPYCLWLLCLFLVATGSSARSYDSPKHPSHDLENSLEKFILNEDDGIPSIDNIVDDGDDNEMIYEDGDGDDDGSNYGGFTDEDAQGKSMDEIIQEATERAQRLKANTTFDPSDPQEKLIKVEYDMDFTQEELEEMNKTHRSKDKRTAAIVNGYQGSTLWKNGQVPYQIKSYVFTSAEINEIKRAMRTWSFYTCLKFVPASKGDRIYFQNGDGCSSRIGRVGGLQGIQLASGCRELGTIVHELGHAIGLKHEQTRPDRDSHVTVYLDNVESDKKFNFEVKTWKQIQNLGIFYDYLSIMHYGQRAFSKNKRITIKTKNPAYQHLIGQRKRLSFRDIKTVNLMYKCREAKKCKLTDLDCPGEGFVGNDCTCWCPGDPFVKCNMNGNTASTCRDYNLNCYSWAKANHCTNKTYKRYMGLKCRKSCGLCSTRTCKDENVYCPDWARSGECQKNPRYMLVKCKKSCNVRTC